MMNFLINFTSSALANLVPSIFNKTKESVKADASQEGGKGNIGNNFGPIHNTSVVNIGSSANDASQTIFMFKNMDSNFIKKNAQILFVDDQNQASLISNLKKNLGWRLVDQLEKEYHQDATCEQYRDADLIFVDFDGVGPKKQGQGLSILNSLLTYYGRKKFYILHTAHPQKITLQKLADFGLAIKDNVGWAQLIKGSPDYLIETTMMHGLKLIEK